MSNPTIDLITEAVERGKFLLIGDETKLLGTHLLLNKWLGVRIVSEPFHILRTLEEGLISIVAQMSADPRIIQTLEGHWVRSLTVKDIFLQFPGPYDLIGLIGSEQDREFWMHESIQASTPKVYVLKEDGHNEQVVKIAEERGYQPYVVGGYLVMVHE